MSAKVYLDTNVFIEAFERVHVGQSPIWRVLDAAERGEFFPITSEISLSELLPKLIVDSEMELIALYHRLFSDKSMFDAVPVTRDVLIAAARLRAGRPSLRLPDAIHLATAAASGCVAILSNDQRLTSISQVPLVTIALDPLSRLRELGR